MNSSIKPLDVRLVGDAELLITWPDGERVLYAAPYLQLACRCAKCVDEWTGERLIKESDIDPEVRIREVVPVGNYAIRFHWNKGCQMGLYSFEYLREITPRTQT